MGNPSNNDSSAERVTRKFLTDARLSNVENERNSNTEFLPSWVQPELIRKGQEFVQQHFFAIYFAHFVSLLFLFCYEPIRAVLVRTEKSNTSSKSLQRYFSTLSHLRSWYEGNLLDENSAASQDILRIRKVHSNVARMIGNRKNRPEPDLNNNCKSLDMSALATIIEAGRSSSNENENKVESSMIVQAVKQDFNSGDKPGQVHNSYCPDPDSSPPISQLDMICTQFCFMGFLSAKPGAFGIFKNPNSSDQGDLSGFVHLWALIGHRIGIEQQFNLCLDSNTISSRTKNSIIQELLISSMAGRESSTAELIQTQTLWESLVNGIAKFIPFMSLPAILSYVMIHVLSIPATSHLNTLFTLYDKICFKLMCNCFKSWMCMYAVHDLLNSLLKLGIFLTTIRLYFSGRDFKKLMRFQNFVNFTAVMPTNGQAQGELTNV